MHAEVTPKLLHQFWRPLRKHRGLFLEDTRCQWQVAMAQGPSDGLNEASFSSLKVWETLQKIMRFLFKQCISTIRIHVLLDVRKIKIKTSSFGSMNLVSFQLQMKIIVYVQLLLNWRTSVDPNEKDKIRGMWHILTYQHIMLVKI